MTTNRCARTLCLILVVPFGLALLANPADAQPRKGEPREVRTVRSNASRVARDLKSLQRALSNARGGADLARCCGRRIDALTKSIDRFLSSSRAVRSRLTRSKSRSVRKSGQEFGAALSDLRTGVRRLKKASDRGSAGDAVDQMTTLQARFGPILQHLSDLLQTSEYAELVAPLNRCTELVRKVCGEENQCADDSTCDTAKQVLGMYNDAATEQEQYDIEGQCIIMLEDPIFSMCVP